MNAGSLPKPVVFSSANAVPGTASRIRPATSSPTSTGIGRALRTARAATSYTMPPLEQTASAVVADVLPELVHPADRPAGDEHDRDAEVLDRASAPSGCGR